VAHPQIATFARLADEDTAPLRRIEGQATLLGRTMHAIDYDEVNDEIVVPQQFAQAILTFRGSTAGNEPPVRFIQGSKTRLARPDRLAVDGVHNEIFVPDGDALLVFPSREKGNVAPIRVLEGPGSDLADGAVAVDPVNNLLVLAGSAGDWGDGDSHQLLIFERTAEGTDAPLRSIRGPKTMLTNTKNVRIQPQGGWILVAEDGDEGGTGLSFVGVWSVKDDGDVPPRWTIGGPNADLIRPRGVVLDPKNSALIVSDKKLNAILSYHVPELF
jgi:hypothetical protein